jgi:hypothetical protein
MFWEHPKNHQKLSKLKGCRRKGKQNYQINADASCDVIFFMLAEQKIGHFLEFFKGDNQYSSQYELMIIPLLLSIR